MDARRVDPRDQAWKVDTPEYRVYFHDAAGASDEHAITGADVAEVLHWAEAHRAGRTFVVYACVPHNGLGLIRLADSAPRAAPRRA